ncbi:MAG: glycosyltransferase family 2 protein [Thermoanaerobaculaceae bacterium]|nr:glycosyltransferase family 2 protein [Thermoanaerobaculaceae bacterium]TAM46360.1 MAG: glycosyltransferase family 2 protein [Acidobacteriota bacterium]
MSGVAAFIVLHNHAGTLRATVAALAAQTARPDRIVVVDNASSDNSLALAKELIRGLPAEVVGWQENRGFAAAANEAIRRTSEPWVLALNPDCRLAPDYVETLLAATARRERAGAATGLLLRAHGAELAAGPTVDSAGIVVTAAGRHLDRGSGRALGSGWQRPAWVFGASGAAALYRRTALEDVAYPAGEVFDETFFSYREDADLAWRLQRRAWRCLYWPAARAWHARGLKPELARRGTAAINRHSVRNRFLLRWSNADWRWRLACFPWWLLRDAAVVAACLTVERSSRPALAEAWALRRRQRARGEANASRALASGWALTRWFLPGGRARRVRG